MADHEKILDNIPKAIVDRESWKVPFKVQIRPSSLPFCQSQFLFAELSPLDVSARDSFMEQVYTGLGSTMHDLVQTYLGRAGILFGMWQCKKCFWTCSSNLGTPYCGNYKLTWVRGLDLEGQPIGPAEGPCSKGYATRYKEFKFTDPVSGLGGSSDGIIVFADHLYVLEIKTKPSSTVVKAMKGPDPDHIAQATTYAEMCRPADYGLQGEIEGVAYCYVPRDYPNKMRFMFHPRDSKTLDNLRVDVPEAKAMLMTGVNIDKAKRVCSTPKMGEDRYCPYFMECFRPDRGQILLQLWEDRQGKDIEAFKGQWWFLSNFSPSEVRYEGLTYPTVEHAYQAAKTDDLERRMTISNIPRPGDAKAAGKKLTLSDDWDERKFKIMAKLVYQKFKKNQDLKEKLLATGDVKLIEGNHWGDTTWGVYKGKGKNALGKILMKVRARLREE